MWNPRNSQTLALKGMDVVMRLFGGGGGGGGGGTEVAIRFYGGIADPLRAITE